jgi:hypothetical protein
MCRREEKSWQLQEQICQQQYKQLFITKKIVWKFYIICYLFIYFMYVFLCIYLLEIPSANNENTNPDMLPLSSSLSSPSHPPLPANPHLPAPPPRKPSLILSSLPSSPFIKDDNNNLPEKEVREESSKNLPLSPTSSTIQKEINGENKRLLDNNEEEKGRKFNKEIYEKEENISDEKELFSLHQQTQQMKLESENENKKKERETSQISGNKIKKIMIAPPLSVPPIPQQQQNQLFTHNSAKVKVLSPNIFGKKTAQMLPSPPP